MHQIKFVIVTAIGLLVALFLGILLPDSPAIAIGLLGALVLFIFLPFHLDFSVRFFLFAGGSALACGFIPGRPTMFELMSLGCLTGAVYNTLTHRTPKDMFDSFTGGHWMILWGLAIYSITLIFIAKSCGVSLNVLGGGGAGGRGVMDQLLAVVYPLAFMATTLPEKGFVFWWRLGQVMSLTFLISEYAFWNDSPFSSAILTVLNPPNDAAQHLADFEKNGVLRRQALSIVIPALTYLLLSYRNPRDLLRTANFKWLVGFVALIPWVFLSGHRLSIFTLVLTLFILFYCYRAFTIPVITICLGAAALVLALIYADPEALPLPAQRALSFLPGVSIDAAVAKEANSTAVLRTVLREEGIKMIPEFLLVGRGYGFRASDLDIEKMIRIDPQWGTYAFSLMVGRFMNGTIGLLVNTGAVGFLSMLAVCLGNCILAFGILRRVWRGEENSVILRISAIGAAGVPVSVFTFFVMHGDAENAASMFAIQGALLIYFTRMLHRRDLARNLEQQVAA